MVTFILWGYVLLTLNLCRTAEVALIKNYYYEKERKVKRFYMYNNLNSCEMIRFQIKYKSSLWACPWSTHTYIWVKFVQIPDHTGNWLLSSLHYIWLNLIITTCIFKDSVLWIFLNCHFRQYSWSQQNHPHHSETPINGPQNS